MNELRLDGFDSEIDQCDYQDIVLNLFPWTEISADETKYPKDLNHFFQLYAQYRSLILEQYQNEIIRYWSKYENHYCDEKLEMIGVQIRIPDLARDEYDLLLQILEQDLLMMRDQMKQEDDLGFKTTELADVIPAGNLIGKKTVRPCYFLKFQKKEKYKINTL